MYGKKRSALVSRPSFPVAIYGKGRSNTDVFAHNFSTLAYYCIDNFSTLAYYCIDTTHDYTAPAQHSAVYTPTNNPTTTLMSVNDIPVPIVAPKMQFEC